jgi:hypothetical protein
MNKALLIFWLFQKHSSIIKRQTFIYGTIVMNKNCGVLPKISTDITNFYEALLFHIVILSLAIQKGDFHNESVPQEVWKSSV